jgi:hypothetical protein
MDEQLADLQPEENAEEEEKEADDISSEEETLG